MERETIALLIEIGILVFGALFSIYKAIKAKGKSNAKKANLKYCTKGDYIEICDPRYERLAKFDSLGAGGYIFYANVRFKMTGEWSKVALTKPNFVKCR